MSQMKNRSWIAATAVVGAFALLGGCSQMKSMMGGDESRGRAQNITLSGSNQVPPVTTTATGSGTVSINADRSVTARITVSGMTPTAAHIHTGAAGANGPVAVGFVKSGDNVFVAPEGARMTEEQYAAYKAGNTYVNVHSARNPGGEIRAQLRAIDR
jgi:CHRD domain-containing protein